MKKIYLILQLILISIGCYSQTKEDKKPVIAIVARSYADQIVLRYFASTPAKFNKANKLGYVVEKAVFKEGVSFDKLNYAPINNSPFKRWEDKKWENELKQLDKKDTTNARLAGLVYTLSDENVKASNGDVLEKDLESLKEEQTNQDMKFAYAIIATNQSKMAAEGLGLRISDMDVILGTTYVYRVHINDNSEQNPEMSYIKVKCESFNEKYLAENKKVKVVEGDERVSFSFPESEEYWAFNVERSDDNGITYKKITKTPSLKLKPHGYIGETDYGYADKDLTNNKKYLYKIFVSTLFADQLLFAEFSATPTDKTPPTAPLIKTSTQINPNQVEIVWETLGKKDADLKGFNIKRGNKIDGKFTLISKSILPTNSTSFIDESFDKEGTNYYIIEAIDQSGNVSQSYASYVTLIDNTPPAKPIIETAVIDPNGKITIKIKPNIEKDFMGYEVLKANSKEHDFSIIQQTYTDSIAGNKTFIIKDSTTLNTLTKKIFYKIRAYDTHFNPSEDSEIIELKKRDTIAPVSPMIHDFLVKKDNVTIYFANSSSEDVISNELLRKEVGKEKYEIVFINSDNKIKEFIDKTIIGGKQYEYTMIAKDDSKLSSKPSRSIFIKTLLNTDLPTPVVKGLFDEKSKSAILNFALDDKLKDRKINIEISRRNNKKSVWTIVKSLEANKYKSFSDADIKGEKEMIYMIRLLENNNTSNYSNQLELKF